MLIIIRTPRAVILKPVNSILVGGRWRMLNKLRLGKGDHVVVLIVGGEGTGDGSEKG